jgi:hypothetical protein
MDLEDSKDVRQMDAIVSEIITQSKANKKLEISIKIVAEAFLHEKVDQISKYFNYAVYVVSVLAVVYWIYKKEFLANYKPTSLLSVSFKFLFVFVMTVFVTVSWGMSWWQCNEELALTNMIKIQMREKKPCVLNPTNAIKRLFSFSNPELEYEQCLKEAYAPLMKYCDPLKVSMKWLANVKMEYFATLLENVMHITSRFTDSFNYISQMVMYPILFIIILLMMGVITKWILSGFFHSIAAYWKSSGDSRRASQNSGSVQAPTINIHVHSSDLKKLKKFKELQQLNYLESSVEPVTGDSGLFDDSKPVDSNLEEERTDVPSDHEDVSKREVQKEKSKETKEKEKSKRLSWKQQV